MANAALFIGAGTTLFGSDILESLGQSLENGNGFYINLETGSETETLRVFERLSEEGNIEMPLQKTGWAKKFGMIEDRFGIR